MVEQNSLEKFQHKAPQTVQTWTFHEKVCYYFFYFGTSLQVAWHLIEILPLEMFNFTLSNQSVTVGGGMFSGQNFCFFGPVSGFSFLILLICVSQRMIMPREAKWSETKGKASSLLFCSSNIITNIIISLNLSRKNNDIFFHHEIAKICFPKWKKEIARLHLPPFSEWT